MLGSEKAEVESHKQLLCLDGDMDVLYNLLEKTKSFMTKGKAKELMKYTVNLDSNLRRSIAIGRSCLFRISDGFPEQKHSASVAHDETTRAIEKTEMEDGDTVRDASDNHLTSKSVRFWDGNNKFSHSQPLVVQLLEKEEELPMPAGQYLKLKKNIHC